MPGGTHSHEQSHQKYPPDAGEPAVLRQDTPLDISFLSVFGEGLIRLEIQIALDSDAERSLLAF
jgi:hypothetical protein